MPHPSKASPDASALDQQVLDLRSTGKSFATIAKSLNLPAARDANAAFLRVVRAAPTKERSRLCDEELARLKLLEDRIRKSDIAPFDRDKQLDVVAHLRKQLLAP